MIFLLYKSLSFSENGRKQTTARRPAARGNFCSKDLVLRRIRTNPAPAYQLQTPGDQGIGIVCPNYAKVIKKFIFLIYHLKSKPSQEYSPNGQSGQSAKRIATKIQTMQLLNAPRQTWPTQLMSEFRRSHAKVHVYQVATIFK